jgi:phenylpyruvate tautomerase PptA (4-oxalocrotonate tautomerase family)
MTNFYPPHFNFNLEISAPSPLGLGMPLYTIYHPPVLSADQRADIAQAITEAHVSITGAPAFLVKVIFIPLDVSSYFTGGHAESNLLRIVGVIRAGRSTEDRQSLLMKIHNDIKDHGYEVEIRDGSRSVQYRYSTQTGPGFLGSSRVRYMLAIYPIEYRVLKTPGRISREYRLDTGMYHVTVAGIAIFTRYTSDRPLQCIAMHVSCMYNSIQSI